MHNYLLFLRVLILFLKKDLQHGDGMRFAVDTACIISTQSGNILKRTKLVLVQHDHPRNFKSVSTTRFHQSGQFISFLAEDAIAMHRTAGARKNTGQSRRQLNSSGFCRSKAPAYASLICPCSKWTNSVCVVIRGHLKCLINQWKRSLVFLVFAG